LALQALFYQEINTQLELAFKRQTSLPFISLSFSLMHIFSI